MPATIKLKDPIAGPKGQIEEIELRDMKAREMVSMKRSPTTITVVTHGTGDDRVVEQRIDTDYELSMKYISKLSGIDDVLLGQLSAQDFSNLCQKVTEMVMPADAGNGQPVGESSPAS